MSKNSLVFYTSGSISSSPAAFQFLFFLSTESSSFRVNCLSLMFSWLLIIFVMDSSVTFGGFPCRFSKYFFRCIRSSWQAAFSLTFAVVFLLLTLFTVGHAILDCLSSTEWRCPWCNCYHRRKWIRRHEFKSWTRLIAFHIALIPLGKVWIQLFSLQLWVNSKTD